MATSVSASYAATGDLSPHRLLQRPTHPQQSILPLRRERTTIGHENLYSSQEIPARSAVFSGEKQYERRQPSTQVRSAKSDEVFRLIDRKLQTGVHGVRLLFRSNDPNREGKLSKDAFRRVLMQLCGFINADEWEKVCRMFHLNERDGTITFEEFLSYFAENEKVKRELTLAQLDRRPASLVNLSQNAPSGQESNRRRYLPKLTANYCFFLMKNRCRDPSFLPSDYLPSECLNNGVIIREHLKKILENFQLSEILSNEEEFEKLWLKFDLDHVGMVRSNVLLRLLDYRVNLADEIDANIQRLVSGSSAARLVDRRTSASSATNNGAAAQRRRAKLNQTIETKMNEEEEEKKTSSNVVPPPPSAMDEVSDPTTTTKERHEHLSSRELSTKFRTLVQQHRKMVKQLHSNDDFLPFLDRKVNEGYFCLKTVFNYLDPRQTNHITKDQLIAALEQFDIPIEKENVDSFLRKHHLSVAKSGTHENSIDYQTFLKYFQDRSDGSFLARTLNTFSKDKSKVVSTDTTAIEHGLIDLLHHLFLSLTAAFKNISGDSDDLCREEDLFLVLRKELNLPENYQFSSKQKSEVYHLLNSSDQQKHKRLLPYKRLLQMLSKTTLPLPKERTAEKKEDHPMEKRSAEVEEKPLTPPRKLSYIEKTLNDLVRLRMHTFTKCFARIDQPRTDKINREQFSEVLHEMGTDLSRSEVNLIWSSSGFPSDRSIPFSNLIRQIIMFNREENHWNSNVHRDRFERKESSRSTVVSSTRALSSADDPSATRTTIDYHQIYNRILPQMRQNYAKIRTEVIEHDATATGLIDFAVLLNILHHYSVPIDEMEFSALIRADHPRNGSKIQYPFFIRKYHPDGPMMKTSPWARVHPIYDQLIRKHHMKNPTKDLYDQGTQNPRDLKYLIRLFHSYDKARKGFLTNDEFHSLLCDNGIEINKSSEDYYQLFSKYDRQLRDQFNYTDFFRSLIYTIMS